jgi:hypothetical protein
VNDVLVVVLLLVAFGGLAGLVALCDAVRG